MLRPNLRRTLKPTLNRFMGGGDTPPAVNYVARLDGVSQGWLFDQSVIFKAGDSIEFNMATTDYTRSANRWVTLIPSGSGDRSVFLDSAGRLDNTPSNYPYFDLYIDGVLAGHRGFTLTDNDYHVFKIIYLQDAASSEGAPRLGERYSDNYLDGTFKDVRMVIDGVTVDIPLTNKAEGATQSNSNESYSFTVTNYTNDIWEVDNAS